VFIISSALKFLSLFFILFIFCGCVSALDDVNSLDSDVGVNNLSSDVGVNSLDSDVGVNSLSSDVGVNSLSSDVGVNSLSSDVGVNSLDSDVGVNSLSSGVGVNSLSSGVGVNSLSSGVGVNSLSSGVGVNSLDSGVGVNGLSSGVGVNGLSSDVGVNGLSSGIDGLSSGVYVDIVSGDDNTGNGSFHNPYASLDMGLNSVSTNGTIFLFNGVYNASMVNGWNIPVSLSIVGLGSNVFLSGRGDSSFFNIPKGIVLNVSNLHFLDGYSNLNSLGAIFLNKGSFFVSNCSFMNMDSFYGTIFNEGFLSVSDSSFVNCFVSNYVYPSGTIISYYGGVVSNIGESIFNDCVLGGSFYNCGNVSFFNVSLNSFTSNFRHNNFIKINNTFLRADNLTVNSFNAVGLDSVSINNSLFNDGIILMESNGFLYNIKVYSFSEYSGGSTFTNSNISVYGCVFNKSISASGAFLNISHSILLGYVSGDYNSRGSLNYNWWGNNKGPNVSYARFNASLWVVMIFSCVENPILVGTSADFIVSLSKFTDGDNLWDLNDTSFLNSRKVFFESENGIFSPNSGYLVNGSFISNLLGNNESILVYAIVDSQRLRLVVGNGSSNYTWFVSNEGHDGFGDGSEEYPFKTLKHTVSRSLTGNIIYLFSGIYTNAWNADVVIGKNVTLVGLDDVVLSRPNGRSFFIVREWGVLNLFNINFTANQLDYANSLIVLEGGVVNIYDCNFYSIRSPGLIYSETVGVDSKGFVNVYNASFVSIVGPCIRGSANVYVFDSYFSLNSNYYNIRGQEDYNYCIAAYNNITVSHSIFDNNIVGAVNFRPVTYSSSRLLNSVSLNNISTFVKIYDSNFTNNRWNLLLGGYIMGLSLTYYSSESYYSIVDNCSFFNNIGSLVFTIGINNSIVVNNQLAQVGAGFVHNSYFANNVNLVQDYDGSFEGNAIVGADVVLNSSFVGNRAAYGGALYNPSVVHYCVFVDNSAYYWGDDIYSNQVDVDCSSNWWGSNQKPDEDRVFTFLAVSIIDNWIIMSLDRDDNRIIASLNSLVDNNRNIFPLNFTIPSRLANFSTDFGVINPRLVSLVNNSAVSFIVFNDTSDDFNVYCTIDHQTLDLTIHNDNTVLVMGDVVFYGKGNSYNISLINVNGHMIFNQTLDIKIYGKDGLMEAFSLITNDKGFVSFVVDYPVGEYNVVVSYGGNGYFKPVINSSKISVWSSSTRIVSYDYVFYGKNNNFYAVLTDVGGRGLVNQAIAFVFTDSSGKSRTFYAYTNSFGRADVILNLDLGEYSIRCVFEGDNWYSASSSVSKVSILPVNSTITVPTVVLYGWGNVYNVTLKDSFGNLIVGEYVRITISQGELSQSFDVLTDSSGVASIAINLVPGKYNVTAIFNGDRIYGPARGSGFLNVEKVNTILSGFVHVIIPKGGYYSVVLSDMFGRRIVGENVTLTVYKGNVVARYFGVTDGFGEVSFQFDLPVGNYLVTMDYGGGVWYLDSTGAGSVVVSDDVVLGKVSINATDFVQYYGEDRYFVISFYDPNAFSLYGKVISVTISSVTWSQSFELLTDVFGFARLQITLNPGVYNISYSYKNPFYGLYASDFNSILVYRMPTTIFASDMILNRGEARYLDIKLVDINGRAVKNMKVSLNISGILHNVTTNADGVARLMISLDPGEYVASFSFSNPSYLPSNGTSKILVVDSDKTSTKLEGNDVNSYDNETLNYTVILSDLLGNGIVGATVYLDVMGSDGSLIGTYHITTNSKGEGIFKLDLDYGSYIFKSYYNGNDKQLASFVSNFVNVDVSGNRIKTIIRGEDSVLNYSDDKAKFYVVLTDSEGNLLIGKEIIFKIGNITYKSVTDNSGRAYLDVSLKIGIYKVIVTFNGEGNFTRANNYYYISVSSGLTVLEGNDLILFFKNGSYYVVRLTDNKGNFLVNKSITFNINGNNYTRVTDNDGYAKIAINLNPGKYEISATYNDNESVAFKRSTITVLPTIEGNNLVKYFRNGSQFHVKIVDGAGKPIANMEVTMNINGVMYKRITNSEGIATLAINLNPRNYTITVIDPNNSLQMSYLIQVLSTIQGSNLEKIYKNGSQYHVKVLDDQGNPIVNRSVRMNINGVFYTRITNSEGVATLSINLFPSTYTITVYHPDNNQSYSNVIKVLPSLTAYDLTLNHKDGSKFQAKLVDGAGKPVTSTNITFNINGVFYTRLTDDLGIARLTINLDPGHYVITSSYDGYSTSNKIDVKTL